MRTGTLLLGLGFLALGRLNGAGAVVPGDLHGDFAQEKRVTGLPMPLKSHGSFALLRGHGMVWRTAGPLPGTVVLGAQGVWALDSAGAPRKLAAGGEALELMVKLLDQDQHGLDGLFEVKRLPSEKGFHQALVPKAPMLKKVFSRVEVWGPESGAVAKAVLSEASGDSTVIRFTDVKPGPTALDPKEEALLGP
jgi:hypothetical protein